MKRYEPLKYVLVALIGFLVVVMFTDRASSNQTAIRDGVFIHISHGSDNVHRALMGLSMARTMSTDKDVLVYIDVTGVELALKDNEPLRKGQFAPSDELLDDLCKSGVRVMVCPSCLKEAGKTVNDLMEGVELADKDGFFSFTKGRILTLDY